MTQAHVNHTARNESEQSDPGCSCISGGKVNLKDSSRMHMTSNGIQMEWYILIFTV